MASPLPKKDLFRPQVRRRKHRRRAPERHGRAAVYQARHPRDLESRRSLRSGVRPLSHRYEQRPRLEDRPIQRDHGQRRRPGGGHRVFQVLLYRRRPHHRHRRAFQELHRLDQRAGKSLPRPEDPHVHGASPIEARRYQRTPEEDPRPVALARRGQRQAEPPQRKAEGPVRGFALRPGRRRIPHRRHKEGHLPEGRKGLRTSPPRLHGRRRPFEFGGTTGRRHRALAQPGEASESIRNSDDRPVPVCRRLDSFRLPGIS